MMMARYLIFWLLAGLLVCCGCSSLASSWKSFNPLVDRPTVAGARNPVVDVACMWQPGEGRGTKGVPARGFAGQVYFFTAGDAEPVLVTGDVRVYLFADAGTMEERARPLHQYDFMADAWKTHASRTSLGPGYNVFVPYPEHAHYQVRCQLRVRYQPPDGPPIWSEALTVVLDGPPRPDDAPITWTMGGKESEPMNQVQISHQRISADKISEADDAESTMRVDTFDVSELRQAIHESSSRRGDDDVEPAKFEKADVEDDVVDDHLSEHPFARLSSEEKQKIIQRLLKSEGLGSLAAVAAEKTPDKEDDAKAHPLANSFKSRSASKSSDHPLRETGKETAEPDASIPDWQTSRHPLSRVDEDRRHWRSRDTGHWRSERQEHPLAWRDRTDESRRRFVAPRPNRAVLLSRDEMFARRADGLGDGASKPIIGEDGQPAGPF